MKKKLRSYLVFYSLPFQILLLIALPIFSTLLVLLPLFHNFYIAAICTSIATLFSVEVLADFWIFGGIAAKDGGHPEYLKTSAQGVSFMRNALIQNQIRQFLVELLIFLLGRLLFCLMEKEPFFSQQDLLMGLFLTLMGYFFTVLATLIARFFSSLNIQFLITMIATVLYVITGLLGCTRILMALPLALLGSITVTVLSDQIMISKIKEAYYDKAD